MAEIARTELYRLIEARHGRFLVNPRDMFIGRSMIAYGEYSEGEWRLLDRILRPGMVVVEVGANIGALTVPIAKKLGRRGMVYAFEPQVGVFQVLCANLALNDLVNVQALNAGCAAEAGWLGILRPDPARANNFGGFSLAALAGDGPVRIRLETLDEVIEAPRVHLIKADVEGMEIEVLRGAQRIVSRHRPFLYLEAHDDGGAGLMRYVHALGYDIWRHRPAMFNPKNRFGVAENFFPKIVSKNIFCAPKERKVKVEGVSPVDIDAL